MGATANLRNFKQSRRRHSRRSVPMAEINVTPFVDVMLVLLIIFMVAAPMLTVGVDVELPKSAANALKSENDNFFRGWDGGQKENSMWAKQAPRFEF